MANDELRTQTLSVMRDRMPEFTDADGYTDTVLNGWIDEAFEFTTRSPAMAAYCAAHLIAVDRAERRDGAPNVAEGGNPIIATVDGGSRLVQSQSMGRQSVTYARSVTGEDRENFFGRTFYGRQFLALERRWIPTIRTL